MRELVDGGDGDGTTTTLTARDAQGDSEEELEIGARSEREKGAAAGSSSASAEAAEGTLGGSEESGKRAERRWRMKSHAQLDCLTISSLSPDTAAAAAEGTFCQLSCTSKLDAPTVRERLSRGQAVSSGCLRRRGRQAGEGRRRLLPVARHLPVLHACLPAPALAAATAARHQRRHQSRGVHSHAPNGSRRPTPAADWTGDCDCDCD